MPTVYIPGRPQVISATGPDGKPVVLRDGEGVSSRDWEHISSKNVTIRELLNKGELRVEPTLEEVVAASVPAAALDAAAPEPGLEREG